MKTNCLVFAAMLMGVLVTTRAQDAAPEESPEDFETDIPVTPVPAIPDELIVCIADENCQTVDQDATCDENGGCVCSTGFEHKEILGVTYRDCFAEDEDPTTDSTIIPASQSGRFPDANFADLTANLRARFIARWEEVMGVKITSASFAAGSILYLFGFSGNSTVVASVSASKAKLVAALVEDTVLNTVLAAETMTTATSVATGACTIDFATQTTEFAGTCVATACEDGYTLLVTGTQSRICIEQGSDDSDDDLSGGAIAGIVIGVVLALAIIAALVAFICIGMKQANAPAENNNAPPPANEPEEEAPHTAPTHDGKSAMDQSGAGLSVYNVPYGDMEADPAQSQLLVTSTAQIES